MAQLSKVVGSILRDLVLAQHEANKYALRLSESCRRNGRGADIPIPAVALGEMELVLRYGVMGDLVEKELTEVDYTALRSAVGSLAPKLAQVVVGSIISSVVSAPAADAPEQENLIVRLHREKRLHRDFTAYLGRRIAETLLSNLPRLTDAAGTPDAAFLTECTLRVSQEVVFDHDELHDLFSGPGGAALRGESREHLKTAVGGILPRLLSDVQFARPVKVPSLDVTVSSKELSKLPEESIQTFRLRISPRDLLLTEGVNPE